MAAFSSVYFITDAHGYREIIRVESTLFATRAIVALTLIKVYRTRENYNRGKGRAGKSLEMHRPVPPNAITSDITTLPAAVFPLSDADRSVSSKSTVGKLRAQFRLHSICVALNEMTNAVRMRSSRM